MHKLSSFRQAVLPYLDQMEVGNAPEQHGCWWLQPPIYEPKNRCRQQAMLVLCIMILEPGCYQWETPWL